jgi:hypothetical protein
MSLASTKSLLQVKLTERETELGQAYSHYYLEIHDPTGKYPTQNILIADLRRMGGGIALDTWEEVKYEGVDYLSLYLELSILGHDLDQWVHYNLLTGEKVEDTNLGVELDKRAKQLSKRRYKSRLAARKNNR